MPLTLTVTNVDRLDNGENTRLVLDRHGAIIGRSPHADWSLPDPKSYLSSTHCEVEYRDGGYMLIDTSTNGTFVNGGAERLAGPHRIKDGDELTLGHYRISCRLTGADATAAGASEAPASGGGGWGSWGDSAPAAPAPAASGWDSASPLPNPGAPAPSGWDSVGAPSAPASGANNYGAPLQQVEKADGWAAISLGGPAGAPAPSAWEREPAAAITGRGAMSQNWAAPRAQSSEPAASAPASWAEPAPPTAAAWGAPASAPSPAAPAWGEPAAAAPSAWGAPAAPAAPEAAPAWGAPAAPSLAPAGAWAQTMEQKGVPDPVPAYAFGQGDTAPADDVWGKLASSNTVDWARGGFGAEAVPAPPPPVAAPVAAPTPPVANAPAAWASGGADWGAPGAGAAVLAGPAAVAAVPAPAPAAAPARSSDADAAWAAFLQASGVSAADLKGGPAQAGATAGGLLKKLIAGMVVMLEARARAKAQLGAQSTTLEFDGNNPLKFARSPERVLTQLLNPPERGFMAPERAVDDTFQDLQAHQMATLAAMQGALRSTLDRFSPEAIRQRAETRGVLAKILPGARNAALWEAYEREFEGVAKGSDEAFMDVFAKAFKAAYDKASAEMKRR